MDLGFFLVLAFCWGGGGAGENSLPSNKRIQDQICDCLYKYNATLLYKEVYYVAAVWSDGG